MVKEAVSQWETEHPESRSRLPEEMERAARDAAAYPSIGEAARSVRLHGVKRIRLGHRVPYWLYYRKRERPHPHIEVLALWHLNRGTPPPI